MSEYILRVEKLENGYEVEMLDPKVQEANSKPKSAWQDPWKGYVCKTVEEVTALITAHLDKIKPPKGADAEYADAFAEANNEED